MRSSADKWDIPFQPTSKKRQAAVYMLEAGEADTEVSRDEVAEHADLPKSTITEVVKNLIDAGYTVTRKTDPYRRAWYRVFPHEEEVPANTRAFPKRVRAVDTIEPPAEPEDAGLTVAVAEAPPVHFKGLVDGEIELTWERAPGVLFRGKADSVPVALLSGEARVESVSVHPSGRVTLDLGFMQVRGTLR